MINSFDLMDTDNEGYLTVEKLSVTLGPDEAERIMKLADKEGIGKLDFYQYAKALLN